MIRQDLEAIREGLRTGRFQNEASVSQGIVLRLLGALGWPTYDTQIVCPEFSLEGRRIDFALCHPPEHPKVFIEVKHIGKGDGGERQLFEYAFHKGVQLAILTDGREWNFFLPAEVGDYGERRVYSLDTVERDIDESILRFERYLRFEDVKSGVALTSARDDYKDVARTREIRKALPQAWQKLVEEEDELLLEILAERVESLCGYKPDLDGVANFLANSLQLVGTSTPLSSPKSLGGPVTPTIAKPLQTGNHAEYGLELFGKRIQARNARAVLIATIEALAARDSSFLDRFVALPRHGRTRRYIAVNKADLYPGRPDLAQEHSFQLPSGHWLGINMSRKQVERIVATACEVAGIRFGTDLKVFLGP